MKIASALILVILYSLLLGGVLWYVYGHFQQPEVVTETEVVYKDRVIEKRDTVTVDRPVTRTIYKVQTDTVEVRIPVPVGFDRAGVISPTPVRLDGRNVTLTYWSPDSLRFIQDRYVVERPAYSVWMDTGLDKGPLGFAMDARINLRSEWLKVFIGYQLAEHDRRVFHGPTFGFRVKLWGTE